MSANAAAPSRRSAAIWRIVAAAVVVSCALLCWNQIARTLGGPIELELEFQRRPAAATTTGGTAIAAWSGVNTALASLTHVSSQLQWLIALQIAIQFVIITAVLLTLGVVWVRTSAGRPFAASVTRSLVGLAIVVAIAGSGSELLQNVIANREQFEALGSAYNPNYTLAVGFSFSGFGLIVAFGISLLASAFAIGARLTKDTEGLV